MIYTASVSRAAEPITRGKDGGWEWTRIAPVWKQLLLCAKRALYTVHLGRESRSSRLYWSCLCISGLAAYPLFQRCLVFYLLVSYLQCTATVAVNLCGSHIWASCCYPHQISLTSVVMAPAGKLKPFSVSLPLKQGLSAWLCAACFSPPLHSE